MIKLPKVYRDLGDVRQATRSNTTHVRPLNNLQKHTPLVPCLEHVNANVALEVNAFCSCKYVRPTCLIYKPALNRLKCHIQTS